MNAPLDQMAKAAVDMVSALIKKQTIKERSATFPVNLIERDSVR
jgi:DNA-binding LacI/PurR family transcriptional regulator